MTEPKAPETVRVLLLKVHALAERGIGGEAENAKRRLESLLKKHNLTIEDVLHEVPKTYEFSYKTIRERKLLTQIYLSLNLEKPGVYTYTKRGKKIQVIGFDLTPAQHIDLKEMVDYYREALEKEMERLFIAFIHRHDLGAPPDGAERPKTDPAEMLKIRALMMGLGEKTFFKPAGLIGG